MHMYCSNSGELRVTEAHSHVEQDQGGQLVGLQHERVAVDQQIDQQEQQLRAQVHRVPMRRQFVQHNGGRTHTFHVRTLLAGWKSTVHCSSSRVTSNCWRMCVLVYALYSGWVGEGHNHNNVRHDYARNKDLV